MTRIPAPDRETLAPEAQAIWDHIAAARSGTMRGPYSMLMHIPELARRVGDVEDYFRFQAELPARDRELVILATAREAAAHYAWSRHEVRAREAGVRPEAIETLRRQGALESLRYRERLLVELARSLCRTRTLPEDLFSRALAELGQTQLVEAVTLVGHYGLIGSIINAFAIPPPDETPTF